MTKRRRRRRQHFALEHDGLDAELRLAEYQRASDRPGHAFDRWAALRRAEWDYRMRELNDAFGTPHTASDSR